jgi:hypothetical protein
MNNTLTEPLGKIISRMRLQSTPLKRDLFILVDYEFHGMNSPYEKIEKTNKYFTIKLETLKYVTNDEISKKLDLFLLTSYFIDKILTRYFILQPFHSWRKNAVCRYRDVRIKSIEFFDNAAMIASMLDQRKEKQKQSIIPDSIFLQYRLRGTNIIVKNEGWSYIEYFSHYHGRYTITVNNFLVKYENTINDVDLDDELVRKKIDRRIRRNRKITEQTTKSLENIDINIDHELV